MDCQAIHQLYEKPKSWPKTMESEFEDNSGSLSSEGFHIKVEWGGRVGILESETLFQRYYTRFY